MHSRSEDLEKSEKNIRLHRQSFRWCYCCCCCFYYFVFAFIRETSSITIKIRKFCVMFRTPLHIRQKRFLLRAFAAFCLSSFNNYLFILNVVRGVSSFVHTYIIFSLFFAISKCSQLAMWMNWIIRKQF